MIEAVPMRWEMPSVILKGKILLEYSYIIMAYCKHGTVLDFLMKANSKNIELPLQFRLYLLKQMILAVHSLHTHNGMAHCDLKPDNMVITDSFKIALIDFCHSDHLSSRLHHVTGTTDYQPPE
jgi:serine/threonine protein kinase